jgi:hypothetical protein
MMAEKETREVRDADDVVREYYEGEESAEAARDDVRDEFRDAQETRGSAIEGEPCEGRADADGMKWERSGLGGVEVVSGGDIDARGDRDGSGEEAVGGLHALPDQDIVEEIGKAVGLTYEDAEPLHTDEKVAKRDVNRWELNPASSEDYEERLHAQREEPDGGKRETPRERSTKRQTGRRA